MATDFSRGADNALERAVRLPLAAGAKLHLLHVLPEKMPSELRAKAEDRARVMLQRMERRAIRGARAAGNTDLKVIPQWVTGKPYIEIIRAARSAGADLVLVGRHGERKIRDLFIGSTAIHVIWQGELPALVVNQRPERPYQRVLAAISLEDTARGILDMTLRVAGPSARRIPVVHAYWPPFEADVLARLTPGELAAYHRDLKKKARSDLKRILGLLSGQQARWKPVVLRGDPRAVVLEEASRLRSDLVVVGTHTRSGLAHVLLGSVADWLIRSAQCDVLVARPARFSFRLP